MSETRWIDTDTSACLNVPVPPKHELFAKVQPRKPGSKTIGNTSVHHWCLSCYARYINECMKVTTNFDPALVINDNNEFLSEHFEQAVHKLIKQQAHSSNDLIDPIKDTSRCINARQYHHKHCFQHDNEIQKDEVFDGDAKHGTFQIILCDGMKHMHNKYIESLSQEQNNSSAQTQPLDLFAHDEEYKNTLDYCNELLEKKQFIFDELAGSRIVDCAHKDKCFFKYAGNSDLSTKIYDIMKAKTTKTRSSKRSKRFPKVPKSRKSRRSKRSRRYK